MRCPCCGRADQHEVTCQWWQDQLSENRQVMSFRCEMCGVAQTIYTTPHLYTVQTRPRNYVNTKTTGTEIVKEIRLCSLCWEKKTGTPVTDE